MFVDQFQIGGRIQTVGDKAQVAAAAGVPLD